MYESDYLKLKARKAELHAPARKPRNKLPPVANQKLCRKCGMTQPLESFSKLLTAKDGVQAYCKGCQKDQRKTRRKHVPEPPTS